LKAFVPGMKARNGLIRDQTAFVPGRAKIKRLRMNRFLRPSAFASAGGTAAAISFSMFRSGAVDMVFSGVGRRRVKEPVRRQMF
jgi:hypothetical protein